MRARPVPAERPNRWPFVRVHLEGVDASPWVFKMPRASQARDVFGDFIGCFRQEGENFIPIAEKAPDVPLAAAEVVRRLWAHESLELAATDAAAALDELHEAGLREQVLARLAAELFGEAVRAEITEAEVAKRADFFGRRERSTPTFSDSSASDGSATTGVGEAGTN